MQTSAMGTGSHIAECSLSYAKIMQTSAMGTGSQIAECSLSYAKIWKNIGIPFLFHHFFILFFE